MTEPTLLNKITNAAKPFMTRRHVGHFRDRLRGILEESGQLPCNDDNPKLAAAITEAAVKSGGVSPGIELTGPQLLLALDDMAWAAKQTADRNTADQTVEVVDLTPAKMVLEVYEEVFGPLPPEYDGSDMVSDIRQIFEQYKDAHNRLNESK